MKEGDLIDGKYELLKLLGEGGMGAVYGAYHRKLGRKVALKFMLPEHLEKREYAARFLREAQAAAAIGSEHIINVNDVGETEDGCPFLVMEYLEGEDLNRILECEGVLEPTRAVDLVLQACRALAAAHERGIIHRDLKPENLFRTFRDDGSEWIKVLDFGIAKVHDSFGDASTRLTATGTMLGTPMYMAPEQACGAKHIDERVDVYALGAILYELLTGQPPFLGETYNEIIVKIATREPLPPTALRAALDLHLEAVVLTAITKNPDERYGSVYELAQALLPFAGDRGISFPPQRISRRDEAPVAKGDSETMLSPAPEPFAEQDADELVSVTAETMIGMGIEAASEGVVQAVEGHEKPPVAKPQATTGQPAESSNRAAGSRVGVIAIAAVVLLGGAAVGLWFMSSSGASSTSGQGTLDAELLARMTPPVGNDASTGSDDSSPGAPAESDSGRADHAAAGTVQISIRVEPESAQLRIDGIEVEGNPYVGRFPRDAAQHRVEAFADGYSAKRLFVSFSDDEEVEIRLRPDSGGKNPGRRRPPAGVSKGASGVGSPRRPPVRRLDKTNPYGGGE